jgi:hypothetical protein
VEELDSILSVAYVPYLSDRTEEVENLNDMMCFLGSGKQEESDTTENGG